MNGSSQEAQLALRFHFVSADAGPRHIVTCGNCRRAVSATEHGVVELDPSEPVIGNEMVTLLTCDACGHILVFVQYDDGNGDGYGDMLRIWPDPVLRLSVAVPEVLRAEHYEAQKCIDAGAYAAAAVMIGRTLEGICSDRGVTTKPLVAALRTMRDQHIINDDLYAWADSLRVLRNDGAHFTGAGISRRDAEDALDFCEALLDYIYVLAERFNAFKKRRGLA